MTKQEAKDRQKEIQDLNPLAKGLPFAAPFTEWSKEHQLEYNALHEIAYRDGSKFSPVTEADHQDGVKYSEAEMDEARERVKIS